MAMKTHSAFILQVMWRVLWSITTPSSPQIKSVDPFADMKCSSSNENDYSEKELERKIKEVMVEESYDRMRKLGSSVDHDTRNYLPVSF